MVYKGFLSPPLAASLEGITPASGTALFPQHSQGGILETLEGDTGEEVSEGTHVGRWGLQEGPPEATNGGDVCRR